jgi:hypothetical protein
MQMFINNSAGYTSDQKLYKPPENLMEKLVMVQNLGAY